MSGKLSQSSVVLTITGKWQNKSLDCFVDISEENLAAIAPCLANCHRAQLFSQLQVNGRINPLTVLLIFLRKTLQQ